MQYRKSIFILSVFAILLPTLAVAYPAEVPRTGQTGCYDAGGNAISCTGTGQDGAIQAGAVWPDPRFTNRGDGTVTDNLTGLVWMKNANLLGTDDAANDTDDKAGDGKVNWQHALDYIKKLNSKNYLGYGDWRLPNINELESLINAELSNPALPSGQPFTNVQSYYYWSSTSYAPYTDYAWLLNTSYGYVDVSIYTKVNDHYYVWPVRSGQCGKSSNSVICLPKTGQTKCYNESGDNITCAGTGQDGELQAGVDWPNSRFTDHGDDTVTDSLTGLMWTKNANLKDSLMTWQQGLDYVKTLNISGYSDWRLPNRRELRSLADYNRYNPALPQNYPFTNVQLQSWSSTTNANSLDVAWWVGIHDGHIYEEVKQGNISVWPVRAGYVDNSTISTTTTTTIPGKKCPAKQVLGADNPKLDNLRDFRDTKLAQSTIGRKIIQIYYNNADSINEALERNPALRAVTRKVLEVIVPIVGSAK